MIGSIPFQGNLTRITGYGLRTQNVRTYKNDTIDGSIYPLVVG
jgi:hypothetical protein